LTIPPKYDKLLLTTYKEKNVNFTTSEPTFGTPATVTPMEYDRTKTLVINKQYYGTPEYALVSAEDVSMKYWRHNALTQRVANYESAHDKVRDYLTENYDELEEHAEEIARLLSIDLSKEVEVQFDVTIKATISIPVNKDVSDLSVYDFDIDISSNESDYDVQDFDADINSIDERY
jgi:hypothetical protein